MNTKSEPSSSDSPTARVDRAPVQHLAAVMESRNSYMTRSWDREVATRYVFKVGNTPTEVSHFEHYLGNVRVKAVVELPLSFGCPVGCRYCASALLEHWRPLQAEEIAWMLRQVLPRHASEGFPRLRIAFAGIGEGSLFRHTLAATCHRVLALYPHASFMLATVGRDASFLSWATDLAATVPVEYLMISYLHHSRDRLTHLIPNAGQWPSVFDDVIAAIGTADGMPIRLNYLVIPGFNDTEEHPRWLVDRLDGMQARITFRVSSLNETPGTCRARLTPPTRASLQGLCQQFTCAGFDAYCFASHRNDNMNCGQLAWNYESKTAE